MPIKSTKENKKLKWNEEPSAAFERVHIDLAHYSGRDFVVLIDAFSSWMDARLIKDHSSSAVIEELKEIFKYMQSPEVIMLDNGTNFDSKEFMKFAEGEGITLKWTPPGHHQSNGRAEVAIRDIKAYLDRVGGNSEKLKEKLREFIKTTNANVNSSGSIPNELMFTKRLRNKLERGTLLETEEKESLIYDERKGFVPSKTRPTNSESIRRDQRNRLVHEADVIDLVTTDAGEHQSDTVREGSDSESVELEVEEEVKASTTEQDHTEQLSETEEREGLSEDCTIPRRSTRERKPPIRLLTTMKTYL